MNLLDICWAFKKLFFGVKISFKIRQFDFIRDGEWVMGTLVVTAFAIQQSEHYSQVLVYDWLI